MKNQEFAIEIPDAEADAITTVGQGETVFVLSTSFDPANTLTIAIDYISKTPEGEFCYLPISATNRTDFFSLAH